MSPAGLGGGCRRQQASLTRQDVTISEKVVQRLMKQECLVVLRPRKRWYASYLGETRPVPENLINRDFQAAVPNDLAQQAHRRDGMQMGEQQALELPHDRCALARVTPQPTRGCPVLGQRLRTVQPAYQQHEPARELLG